MFDETFRVDGQPKGQPRARAFATPSGMVRMYNPGTAEAWKSAIALAVKPHIPAAPISGPIRLIIHHYMPRPKNHFRTGKYSDQLKPTAPRMHTQTPDVDNMAKAAMDALTTLRIWHDDDQVCECLITKQFGDRPGARIRIMEIQEVAAEDDDAFIEASFL